MNFNKAFDDSLNDDLNNNGYEHSNKNSNEINENELNNTNIENGISIEMRLNLLGTGISDYIYNSMTEEMDNKLKEFIKEDIEKCQNSPDLINKLNTSFEKAGEYVILVNSDMLFDKIIDLKNFVENIVGKGTIDIKDVDEAMKEKAVREAIETKNAIFEIDESTKSIIDRAIEQWDDETLLNLSKSDDISLAVYLANIVKHTITFNERKDLGIEILKNLKDMPVVNNYPEIKEKIRISVDDAICDSYNDKLWDLKHNKKNSLEDVTDFLNSIKSEMSNLNNNKKTMNGYCEILVEMYKKLDIVDHNPELKKEIEDTFKTFNDNLQLKVSFSAIQEFKETGKRSIASGNITKMEFDETIENKTSKAVKSLDEEIAEKANETIAENATNLSETIENVKLLMTRFVMENKGPEETEALKKEISKGVKECQSDPEAIDDIKGTLTTFIFFAGMPGLENKMSELRKIIDNATSKDEIDI